jgi:antirestriction protein
VYKYNHTNMRIYITNLKPYDNGKLQGEWVTLPLEDFNNDFKAILKRIGNPKEYYISDYECEYYPVGKYADVEDLNRLAQHYNSLDQIDQLRLNFFIQKQTYDIDDIIMCDLGYIDFYQGMSLEDVARDLFGQGYFGDMAYFPCDYIDFKAIAKDLGHNGYVQTDKGVFYYN